MVLQRRIGEEIVIVTPNGDRIYVQVPTIRGRDCVRIGIAAPPSYEIDRSEVREAKDREAREHGCVAQS